MQDLELKITGGKITSAPVLQRVAKLFIPLDGYSCSGEVTPYAGKITFYKNEYGISWQVVIDWHRGAGGLCEVHKGGLMVASFAFDFAVDNFTSIANEDAFRYEFHNLVKQLEQCKAI